MGGTTVRTQAVGVIMGGWVGGGHDIVVSVRVALFDYLGFQGKPGVVDPGSGGSSGPRRLRHFPQGSSEEGCD